MYKLQSIQPKQNKKQITQESNKLCMEDKVTRSVKKNNNNFIMVKEEKFAMNIRWRKLTISFCKKL